jgi:hypothetical protein
MSASPKCSTCGDYVHYGPVLCEQDASALRAEVERKNSTLERVAEALHYFSGVVNGFLPPLAEHAANVFARAERAEAALRGLISAAERTLGYVKATESNLVTRPNIVTNDVEAIELALGIARAALHGTAPPKPEATDGHWPDVNVGNPTAEEPKP